MKKIVFLATMAYPLFNKKSNVSHGGSEVQVSAIAKELAKEKDNYVCMIVGNYNQEKIEYYDDVEVIRSFNPGNKSTGKFSKLIGALRYFFLYVRLSPDICITSSANSTVGIVAFYSKIFRKKHIHRCANIIDVNKQWINNNGFLGKIYKYGLENAFIVLCQTEEQQENLLKFHGRSSVLFRNIFEIQSNEKIKKKDYLLWVGRTHTSKKPELFVELAKMNPKLNFIMILNNQNQEYFKQIENEIKQLKNIKLIEKVPFNKIQKYFDEAKLFISTSDFEGFANTFIQSGIGKTPVFSLNSNPDNFIDEYRCGYYARGDLQRLNKNINKILKDKKQYLMYAGNIHTYVKAKYDVKENIKVIKELL